MAFDSDLINLDLSSENNQQVKSIEVLLKPEVPVLVSNHRKHGFFGGQKYAYLFFSDGTINDNKLGVLKGERNYVFAEVYDKGFSINQLCNTNHVIEFVASYFSQHHEFNEGTFSGCPSSWILTCSGGSEVIVGEDLSEKFKEVLASLCFAGDAIHFRLNHFYYSGKASVLCAVAGLIGESYRNSGIDNETTLSAMSHFECKQVGKEVNRFKNYNLVSSDYLLSSVGPFAYVKVEGSEAYVIPDTRNYGGKLVKIVEDALSPEFIKQHYPHGF